MLRQYDDEGSPFALEALHAERAAVALRDDVVGERQPQSCVALARRLRREKRLEDLASNFCWDAGAVVRYTDLDVSVYLLR